MFWGGAVSWGCARAFARVRPRGWGLSISKITFFLVVHPHCGVTHVQPSLASTPLSLSACFTHLSSPCIATLLPSGTSVVHICNTILHWPGGSRSTPRTIYYLGSVCCLQSLCFCRGGTVKLSDCIYNLGYPFYFWEIVDSGVDGARVRGKWPGLVLDIQ